MDQEKKICGGQIIVAFFIVSLALIASSYLISQKIYQSKKLDNTIQVTGLAEKNVTSDTVKWNTSFSRNAEVSGLKDGLVAMKQDLEKIVKYFKEQGIKENEITFESLNITPVCESSYNTFYDKTGTQGCAGNHISNYNLQQNILIQSDNVQKITDISRSVVDTLINQGIVFSSLNLEYYYSHLADLRMELIDQATKNAKMRAEQVAKATGTKLGSLQSINTGTFQITSVNSAEVSDYGYYDTSVLEKKISTTVRASFYLN